METHRNPLSPQVKDSFTSFFWREPWMPTFKETVLFQFVGTIVLPVLYKAFRGVFGAHEAYEDFV
jgi:hypothetical protein